MTVIVMSREMGTLGKDVARIFAERMNYPVLYAELDTAPGRQGESGRESEVYRFLDEDGSPAPGPRGKDYSHGYVTPERLLEIAAEGSVLIRGWGATRLLKSVPHVLSVRVYAPMEFRIREIQKRLAVDARTAEREIRRSDAAHGRAFLRFFEADWRDVENYDIVFNMAHLTPALCATMLIAACADPVFAPDEEARHRMNDMLLRARISQALREDPAIAARAEDIAVSVDNGEVRLYGVARDDVFLRNAERVAAAQAGVAAVRNDIVRMGGFIS